MQHLTISRVHRSLRRVFWAIVVGVLATALLPGTALAAGGEGQKELIDPSIMTIVWTVVVFLIVMAVLRLKAWGPMIAALDEREQKIRESLEAADRMRAESQQAAAEHERVLAEARKEATAIVEEGKRDAVVVKETIVATAKRESEELKNRALAEIERAKNNAVYEIHDRAVDLSYEIVEKLISKSLSPEDHDALIKETLDRYQQQSAS